MAQREQVFIGLGANIGRTRRSVRQAFAALRRLPTVTRCRLSRLYRSAPVDAIGPDYLNAVACLECSLAPHRLLQALQRIEDSHGRERPYRYAPRTLDLDVLLYGRRRVQTPRLTVPHPRLHQRAFVLYPLLSLAPNAWVPGKRLATAYLRAVSGQPIHLVR